MNKESVSKPGVFVPATPGEANGEIMGRCNALHDWLMDLVPVKYGFSGDLRTVCLLMGFADVLAVQAADENEKAGVTSTD